MRVKPVRRHAERLLERPAEMVGAQPRELGQGRKRDLLREVILDVGRDGALLPGREPAPDRGSATAAALIEAHELMRQHGAEGFAIEPIVLLRVFDQGLELDGHVPQGGVFEEQARRESRAGDPGVGIKRKRCRIEIEIRRTGETAWLLPIIEFMAGGHENQLALVVSQGRARQALDEGDSIAALAAFEEGEEVDRRTEAAFDLAAPRRVHGLRRHPVQRHGTALHDIGWGKFDPVLDRVGIFRLVQGAIERDCGSRVVAAAQARKVGREIGGSARSLGHRVKGHRHVSTIWSVSLRCA